MEYHYETKEEKGFSIIEIMLMLIVVILITFVGFYIYHAQKNTNATYDSSAKVATSQPAVTAKTAALATAKYTSSVSNESFSYPANWSVITPKVNGEDDQLNPIPGFSIQSPDKKVTVSYATKISGLGGICDDGSDATTGAQACPDITVVKTEAIPNVPNLLIVSGYVTDSSRSSYLPWMAVQQKDGLTTSTKASLGYDLYKTSTSADDADTVLTTSGITVGSSDTPTYKTAAEATAFLTQADMNQAKTIVMSLSEAQ